MILNIPRSLGDETGQAVINNGHRHVGDIMFLHYFFNSFIDGMD